MHEVQSFFCIQFNDRVFTSVVPRVQQMTDKTTSEIVSSLHALSN